MTNDTQVDVNKYWLYAFYLALFTIIYNLAEGLVSIYFGAQDEALTLFGFGIDLFIEVMSGLGILAMVVRISQKPGGAALAVRADCPAHHRHFLLYSCCWVGSHRRL